ncbi:1223_t:CDS:2, partial [Paraglomus occultum]
VINTGDFNIQIDVSKYAYHIQLGIPNSTLRHCFLVKKFPHAFFPALPVIDHILPYTYLDLSYAQSRLKTIWSNCMHLRGEKHRIKEKTITVMWSEGINIDVSIYNTATSTVAAATAGVDRSPHSCPQLHPLVSLST